MTAKTPMNFDDLPDGAYLRKPQVLQIAPFSAPTMYRKIKEGTFPKPVHLSERVSAWQVGAIRKWLASQAAQ
ncbi:AlpA family phage regulatory protein [Rhodoferax sp. GW822-FHT02A01]|uniref:helix-turn-helix transcriptional regulator n=1 Tax=Rhodoferax sp. GW822-FHT02A01 TaxID=3141537 RepID=UPI00315DF778